MPTTNHMSISGKEKRIHCVHFTPPIAKTVISTPDVGVIIFVIPSSI